MRPTLPLALTLTLTLAAAGCNRTNLDPDTADIVGNVAVVDAASRRLGVSTGRIACITAPCYDYSVHVAGKVYQQVGLGYREVAITDVSVGTPVWIWSTGGVRESFPMQVEARQVLIPDYAIDVSRKQKAR